MMKKIFLIIVVAVLTLPTIAQTDFRHLTYEEAVAAAKTENKLVFMDFYTSWCGPCKMMTRDVFPQKALGNYLNERFVCIKLDAEKEGKELAKRYKVHAYPTFVGVDVDGKEVMRKVGMAQADEFIAAIEWQIVPEKAPERLKQRYKSGERTAELISTYADLKISESRAGRKLDEMKRQEAFAMVHDYFKGLKDSERLASENLFVYMHYLEGVVDTIAVYMMEHRNEFAPPVKEQIAERIEQLFQEEISGYLSCSIPFNEPTYWAVKKNITDLGLNKDGKYSPAYRLIESHAAGDLNVYLDVFEKEYTKLTPKQQSTLMSRFSSIIDIQDEAVRKRASKFIRSLLPEMEANLILWVGMELSKIEQGDKH